MDSIRKMIHNATGNKIEHGVYKHLTRIQKQQLKRFETSLKRQNLSPREYRDKLNEHAYKLLRDSNMSRERANNIINKSDDTMFFGGIPF